MVPTTLDTHNFQASYDFCPRTFVTSEELPYEFAIGTSAPLPKILGQNLGLGILKTFQEYGLSSR